MLELKNISYIVEGDKEILEDVNLTINDKFVAITGPNGSGKSTLAALLERLFPCRVVHTDDFYLPPARKDHSGRGGYHRSEYHRES